MVDQPRTTDDREQLKPALYRNRAVTTSSSRARASSVHHARPWRRAVPAHSVVDTRGLHPGRNKVFEDESNLGVIDLATILAKSSNVGTAKCLVVKPEQSGTRSRAWASAGDRLKLSGRIGRMLSHYSHWRPIGIATLSHGYGLSVSAATCARVSTIGAGGIKRPSPSRTTPRRRLIRFPASG